MSFNSSFFPVKAKLAISTGIYGAVFTGAELGSAGSGIKNTLSSGSLDGVPPMNNNGYFTAPDGKRSAALTSVSDSTNTGFKIVAAGVKIRPAINVHIGPPLMIGAAPQGVSFEGKLGAFTFNTADAGNTAYNHAFNDLTELVSACSAFANPPLGAPIGPAEPSVWMAKADGTVELYTVSRTQILAMKEIVDARVEIVKDNEDIVAGPKTQTVSPGVMLFYLQVKHGQNGLTQVIKDVTLWVRNGSTRAYTLEEIKALKEAEIQKINASIEKAKAALAKQAKGQALTNAEKSDMFSFGNVDKTLFDESELEQIDSYVDELDDLVAKIGLSAPANTDSLYSDYVAKTGPGALDKAAWLSTIHGPAVDTAKDSGFLDIIKAGGNWLGDAVGAVAKNADSLGNLALKTGGAYAATKATPNLVVIGGVILGTAILLN